MIRGGQPVAAVYRGGQSVKRVYRGDTEVWSLSSGASGTWSGGSFSTYGETVAEYVMPVDAYIEIEWSVYITAVGTSGARAQMKINNFANNGINTGATIRGPGTSTATGALQMSAGDSIQFQVYGFSATASGGDWSVSW